MKIKQCIDCRAGLGIVHSNKKRCEVCRIALAKNPKGTMTKEQIEEAKRLAGTMPRDVIADALGVSLSNLKRSCKGTNFFFFNRWANNPDFVKEVCSFYEENGEAKTIEKYPGIKLRSIVERYKLFNPRCVPWKNNELIELVKFAGLVSYKKQAEFFNRPRANEGSIVSVWVKKFKTHPKFMHGLPVHKAKLFLKQGFPTVKVPRAQRGSDTDLVLFCDAKDFLAEDCPLFVAEAIKAIAEFQVILFGEAPRAEIENILAAFNS